MIDKLGKYKILKELGQGTFAIVYQATDTTLDRDVALKVLRPVLISDPGFVSRFRQEAKTVAGLKHPHIITVYEVSEADGYLFIAMELAKGADLEIFINQHDAIPWDETLKLLKPICDALDYAHKQGIVHRDLKPANILIDTERGPLLSDFGFARWMSNNSLSFSMSGGIIGTPAYIAPEIWDEDASAVPADVYALACITYEMLTGKVLFKGNTPMQTMRAHDKGANFDAEQLQLLPAGVDAVLQKALHRDPTQRYRSAGAFWFALKESASHAQAAQEAEAQAGVIAQWRTETENAMEEKEWRAAKMAVSRWLAMAPNDTDAKRMQAQIESALAPKPKLAPKPNVKRETHRWLWVALAVAAVIMLAMALSNRPNPAPPNMVFVPSGEFTMGSDSGNSDEQPVHTVYLDGFYIDKYEVTNAQYADFLNAKGNQSEGGATWLDAGDPDANIHQNGSTWQADAGYENHPVIEVTWYGAQAYCQWAGKQLPTEAQWEKAARGTDGRTYPWGEGIDCDKAQYSNCGGQTVPVGTKNGVSPYGAYDMAGNVWEWVADWYDWNYYANSPVSNPGGPATGQYRVLRGGSWYSLVNSLRAANRNYFNPDYSVSLNGFRCVLVGSAQN